MKSGTLCSEQLVSGDAGVGMRVNRDVGGQVYLYSNRPVAGRYVKPSSTTTPLFCSSKVSNSPSLAPARAYLHSYSETESSTCCECIWSVNKSGKHCGLNAFTMHSSKERENAPSPGAGAFYSPTQMSTKTLLQLLHLLCY